MQQAVNIAQKSGNDVPVGAIIVKDGEVIASACNEREKNNDPAGHAEILAIRQAALKLNNWRLDDCELYVTLEPCPMCAWAILQSRIKTVYFGSFDKQYGAFGSAIDLRTLADSNLKVYGGILEKECDNVLESFWENRRVGSLTHHHKGKK
ncbi:MAG: nucleoside deaminase [Candidatus Gastranaerophilales bacterium]|nr:nucleoside deaminase [Candidatus Gastranaerophilales bacterium]